MIRVITSLCLLSSFLLLPVANFAQEAEEPTLHFANAFNAKMVLQQEKPLRIFGHAKPNAKVEVTITQEADQVAEAMEAYLEENPPKDPAEENEVEIVFNETKPAKLPTQKKSVQADKEGRWLVEFPAAKASFTPTYLLAKSGEETAFLPDVLIGEVWLCAGQSNMGWGGWNRSSLDKEEIVPGVRYTRYNNSWYQPKKDYERPLNWQEAHKANSLSAVPFLFARNLHRYLHVPVGVLNVARGGTLGITWCLREELNTSKCEIVKHLLKEYDAETKLWEDPKEVEKIMKQWEKDCDDTRKEWEAKCKVAKAEGKPEPRLRLPKKPSDPRAGWSPPAGMFNATVWPFRDLNIRGVLYYQGENNHFGRTTQYEATFPLIAPSFRRAFRDPNLPFGCILQPGWGQYGKEPEMEVADGGYAIVRDIQRRTLRNDPNAGLIATYPAGNSNIHPGSKAPVAHWAGRWALAKIYGAEVIHTGPVFEKMVPDGKKLKVYFKLDPQVQALYEKNHGGPDAKNPPNWLVLPVSKEGSAKMRGLIVADAEQRWYPAEAKPVVKSPTEFYLEVWSELCEKPVALRYGWANWPDANLVGRDNIPTPTFRTDDWPLVYKASHTEEARERSKADAARRQEIAEKMILERKMREFSGMVPSVEAGYLQGKDKDTRKYFDSKMGRMKSVLTELQDRFAKEQYQENEAAIEKMDALMKAFKEFQEVTEKP